MQSNRKRDSGDCTLKKLKIHEFRKWSGNEDGKKGRKTTKVYCWNEENFASPFSYGLFLFLHVTFLVNHLLSNFVTPSKAYANNYMSPWNDSIAFNPYNLALKSDTKDVRVFPSGIPIEGFSTEVSERRSDNMHESNIVSIRNETNPYVFQPSFRYPSEGGQSHAFTVRNKYAIEEPERFNSVNDSIKTLENDGKTGRENARSINEYRPHEINELMQKGFDENQFRKKAFRNRGSPFRLSSKGPDFIHHTHRMRTPHTWIKSSFLRNKKKPLTLLMDIYPMNHEHIEEDRSLVEGSEKKLLYKPNPRENILYIPIKSKNMLTESMLARLISAREKQNRMVVKLNLYPTGKKYYRKPMPGSLGVDEDDEGGGSGDLDEEAYLELMRSGRRHSPSLSIYKKRARKRGKPKKCSLHGCRGTSAGIPAGKIRKMRRFYPVGKSVKNV